MRSLQTISIQDWKIALLIFLISFCVYSLSPVIISTDSKYSVFLSESLIREQNYDLDEYVGLLNYENRPDYQIIYVNGHYYPYYPVGVSLLSTPMLFVVKWSLGLSQMDFFEKIVAHVILEKLFASFFSAAAITVFYNISRYYLDQKFALLISGIYAFGTTVWSVASRGLWMHSPSILLLEIGLLILISGKNHSRYIPFAALPLTVAYIIRPTNIVPLVLFSLYVVYTYRRWSLPYAMILIGTLIPFFMLNQDMYGTILAPYFTDHAGVLGISIFSSIQGIFGNLFSPARGIFFYSPIFILSLWGLLIKVKQRIISPLDFALISIIILHILSISLHPAWWGGHSFGPRLMSDVLPFLMLFMIPVFASLQEDRTGKFSQMCVICFLIVVSVLIHWKGAYFWTCWSWNYDPVDIDSAPWRLWDVSDIQFLRQ